MSGRAVMPGRDSRATSPPSNERTVLAVPRMERPSGWSGKAMACRCSKIRSSGVSATAPISWTMTFCSRRISSRIEGGFGENVGKHVERQRHVGLEHARIIGGALGAGRGIEIAAHGLDLLGDLPGGASPRALERHVFEEMRNAVLVAPFVAAAGIDPHAERGRLEMRHRVGHDIDAGFQGGHRNAHAAAPSCAARLVDRTKRSTAD